MVRWTVFDETSQRALAQEGLHANLVQNKPEDALACALKSKGVAVLPGMTPNTALLVSVRQTRTAPNLVATAAEPSKHYYATGFLGLSDEAEPEAEERPWWKRLVG